MKRTIQLNFKSGNNTILTTELSLKQLHKRIKENRVDLCPDTFLMIRWSEVESIVNAPTIKNKDSILEE